MTSISALVSKLEEALGAHEDESTLAAARRVRAELDAAREELERLRRRPVAKVADARQDAAELRGSIEAIRANAVEGGSRNAASLNAALLALDKVMSNLNAFEMFEREKS